MVVRLGYSVEVRAPSRDLASSPDLDRMAYLDSLQQIPPRILHERGDHEALLLRVMEFRRIKYESWIRD